METVKQLSVDEKDKIKILDKIIEQYKNKDLCVSLNETN